MLFSRTILMQFDVNVSLGNPVLKELYSQESFKLTWAVVGLKNINSTKEHEWMSKTSPLQDRTFGPNNFTNLTGFFLMFGKNSYGVCLPKSWDNINISWTFNRALGQTRASDRTKSNFSDFSFNFLQTFWPETCAMQRKNLKFVSIECYPELIQRPPRRRCRQELLWNFRRFTLGIPPQSPAPEAVADFKFLPSDCAGVSAAGARLRAGINQDVMTCHP